jgi:hypothetical protein
MATVDAFAAAVGRALAHAVEALGLCDRVRAAYAAEHGACRACGRALGGPSPERVCVECHAGETLAAALGGGKDGEA